MSAVVGPLGADGARRVKGDLIRQGQCDVDEWNGRIQQFSADKRRKNFTLPNTTVQKEKEALLAKMPMEGETYKVFKFEAGKLHVKVVRLAHSREDEWTLKHFVVTQDKAGGWQSKRLEVADSHSMGSFKAFDFRHDKGITTRVRELLAKGYSESIDDISAPDAAKKSAESI